MRLKDLPRSALVPVGAAGFLLSLALGWVVVYFFLSRDTAIYPRRQDSGRFSRELQQYDVSLFRESNENAEKQLQQLEKLAGTQEERLSVLKRWRVLARGNPAFSPGYEAAVLKAAGDFPYSESLAAVAVEAAYLYGRNDALLSGAEVYASRLRLERFDSLILSYHVLSGTFREASKAFLIPQIRSLLSVNLVRLSPEAGNDLLVDDILFRIVKGETQGVSVAINNLISENPQNQDFLRLGAEYFYGSGNPLYAAALFARLGDISSLSREADALVLAGEVPAARNILTALASPSPFLPSQNVSPELLPRVFYNLAATAESERETQLWLDRLIAAGDLENLSPVEVFGIIRYSRLYDTQRSIALLEGSKDPFLDLELLRRRMDTWQPERWVPEIWLLLGRHPENEDIYRWSAAFFDLNKLYEESAQLLRLAANHQFDGAWVFLHRSLALLREGRHDEGERLLKEALNRPQDKFPPWIIYANLGRLNESRRSISLAAENYELAANLAGDNPAAALLHLHLSRCYETLGRFGESRQALQRAEELDPENINVRYELGRLGLY